MRTQSAIKLLAVLGLLLGASGCIPVVLIHPQVDRVFARLPQDDRPATESIRDETISTNERDDVSAFLISHTYNDASPYWSSHRVISMIPIGPDGTVSKSRVTIESSLTFYSPLTYGYECKHRMNAMLFRPGFKTIDVSESNDPLTWQPVTSLVEYEQSIDQIVLSGAKPRAYSFDNPFKGDPDVHCTTGLRGEREALLRLGAEYSRLLELVRQNESHSPASLTEQLSIRALQKEIRELAAIQDPSDSVLRQLAQKQEQLEFESRWLDTISRLELKIAWLEARARATEGKGVRTRWRHRVLTPFPMFIP